MRSEKLEFPGHDGAQLAGRIEWPDGALRAFALFAHCFTCSKDIAAASRISRALSRRGIAVLRFDFTGLGNSGGDFANTNFSSNVEDLLAAAEHLRAHHRAPALLVGHSLGGAAVLAAASRVPEVRAVATIGAPSHPAHLKGVLRDALPEIEARGRAEVNLAGRRFTIQKQLLDDLAEPRLGAELRRLQCATLILHSPKDEVVGIEHARTLYQALPHPKSFVSLDDADHLLTERRDSEYVADVLSAWAQRYVDTEPAAAPAATEPGEVVVEGDADGFFQTVAAGRHAFVSDEPLRAGGDDGGPTPYDLLLAALGACTSMTLGMYARHKKWPLRHVRVRLAHSRVHAEDCADCDPGAGSLDRIDRELTLLGELDDSQRQRLLEIADRCPVHRTLQNQKQLRTVLAPPRQP